ncbi:putative serine/threonine protein kinase [Labilithrix luteola]|uniref:Putative serine/threonine protein kinase n=2 Tax=Labilithrix luteola TaxID=1391654 RepID=A0A0K1QDS1_9BACT|nr:putative serine/threonine protein kinase [Labilithrix luteola]
MGFWSFLKGKPESPESARPATTTTTATIKPVIAKPAPAAQAPVDPLGTGLPPDIARLTRAGLAGGPTSDEAIALLAELRRTPDEARAVEELARTSQIRPLPEPLLLALGSAMVDRGEPEAATRVLANAGSSAALVLRADLAEQKGDVATALALIERVLLRDLDHYGARERHRRFRTALGFEVEQKATTSGVTVVTREPDAPFDLLREVGRGGAGAVYEAVDRELGRHVALKVYHQPERDRAQLAHEARVAVALEGPGVVRVFDVDPDHGWLALEWASLGTLREHIHRKDLTKLLPIERWALPLASALARVHAAGWVHHDVKPANVLVARGGAPILTDFGTAKKIGEPSPPGSLGYVSPERMAGRASEPRDDVYGFGRVLEDVLHVVTDESIARRFRSFASACTGPDSGRPMDGRALVTRLRVEFPG